MRAILNVLNRWRVAFAREVLMDPDLAKLRLWFRNHFLPAMEAPGEARGEARGEAKGKAKGKQQALLVLLSARELPVSSSQRKQIDACTDHDVLDTWIRRAASASSVAKVLAPVARSPRKATAKPARPRAKPARPKAKPARPRAKPARPTAPGRATRAEGTDRSSAAPAQTPSRRRRSIQRET